MRFQRLLTMGFDEFAGRARQETCKWLDRTGVAGLKNGRPEAVFGKLGGEGLPGEIHSCLRQGDLDGGGRMLLDHFRRNGPGRFFAGALSDSISSLPARRLPSVRDPVLDAAEAILRKRFDLLGYRGLFFGDPVDWYLDPVSGRRAPRVHWSRLKFLDATLVGDSKVIWELNRHQWMVLLGQAYRLTGEERYAEAFAASVREWLRDNPPGTGMNWASSLEVALRLISWCWALFLFRESAALSAELFVTMLEGIWTHASHVERYLSYYFAPNTHLTGEALGLFYAGVLFPEFRAARRWRVLGTRILTAQSDQQVLPDGVYFEQSTCYQRYTAETYFHFLILARRNELAIPKTLEEKVQGLLDFLLAVRRPDGAIPQIGDADGGWLLPLAVRSPEDFRGVFSTAAALFGRPDYAWAAGGPGPETLWLLGAAGVEAVEALRPAPPEEVASRLFVDGGYAVMRSGWEEGGHHLIFDVGPLGCPVSAGHGHADLLGVQCSVSGVPYLVDSGTYCYTGESQWRDFFRSTAAHSTVLVDHLGQAVPTGPFRWDRRPRARLRRWISTETFDLADAEHDAYGCLPDPVHHRRRVLFVKPRYWIIVDDLDGESQHQVEVRFQFAPMEITVDSALWGRARRHQGPGLLVRPFADVSLRAEVRTGEVDPIQGWVSSHYGRREPAPVLVYSTTARLPVRFLTLLLPAEDPLAPPPAVSLLRDGGPGPSGIAWESGEVVRFEGPDGVILGRENRTG